MTPVEFSDEEMVTFREKQTFKTACFGITNCPVLLKIAHRGSNQSGAEKDNRLLLPLVVPVLQKN